MPINMENQERYFTNTIITNIGNPIKSPSICGEDKRFSLSCPILPAFVSSSNKHLRNNFGCSYPK
jgi:hypothetical protein